MKQVHIVKLPTRKATSSVYPLIGWGRNLAHIYRYRNNFLGTNGWRVQTGWGLGEFLFLAETHQDFHGFISLVEHESWTTHFFWERDSLLDTWQVSTHFITVYQALHNMEKRCTASHWLSASSVCHSCGENISCNLLKPAPLCIDFECLGSDDVFFWRTKPEGKSEWNPDVSGFWMILVAFRIGGYFRGDVG